jgi:hypothetical protein
MTDIGNQVQNLTDKLLTPFSEHIFDKEIFFKYVSELIRQSQRQIEE